MANLSKEELYAKLCEPFPADCIQWRVGSTTKDKAKGLALPYVDARAIMERLDELLGFDNWWDTYTVTGKSVVCKLTLSVGTTYVTKADGADMTEIEATKGGISDALKRAAVKFGMGRYLYRLPPFWVKLEPRGRSYVIANGATPQLPSWALPEGTPATQPRPIANPEPTEHTNGEIFQQCKRMIVSCSDRPSLERVGLAIKKHADAEELSSVEVSQLKKLYNETKENIQ